MHNIKEKQGYKYTEEFGYIPEDWDIVPLVDFISTEKYAIVDGPFGSNLKTEHYRKKGIPIIQSGFVTSNKFIADSYLYVDQEKFQQEIRSKVIPGDIVMAKIGANCGTCALLPSNHPEGILAGNSLKITVSENCNKFLMYLFHRLLPLNKMEEAISRTAQPALSCGRLKILPIIKPPLPEQEKIAEILSDIDELIEATQKLIDKKKDLKTATIQKLLMPEKEWTKTSLGCIANIQRGASPRPIESPVWFDSNSNIGWTRITDVKGKYLEKTEQKLSRLGVINSRFVERNNLIMSICATLGRPTITKVPVCIHDGFVCFYDLTQDMEFVYYFLEFIKSSWSSQGQVGSQSNLNSDLIKNTIICFPCIDEQQKIAQTLSDMDSEIEALGQELSKYKDLKTGMMQELLTGKKRLV